MKKRKVYKKLKANKRLLTLLGILLAALVLFIILLELQFGIFSPKPIPSKGLYDIPEQTIYNVTTPSPTIGSVQFVSTRLGVIFNYISSSTQTTTEIGNKICIHLLNSSPESGECIIVFDKSPEDTIDTAIKKQFLTGYSKTACQLKKSPESQESPLTLVGSYPNTYSLALIYWKHPRDYANKQCPIEYSQTGSGGHRYFISDTDHPTKLIFIDGMETVTRSGNLNQSWFETIRFIDIQ